jgi:hypothetical protein
MDHDDWDRWRDRDCRGDRHRMAVVHTSRYPGPVHKRLNYNDRAWSSFATRDFVSKSEANTVPKAG